MRIALVDDDARSLTQLRRCFALAVPDAEFSEFSSGEAFLAVWRAGAFDLVLLDIFMGAHSGVDVARIIRGTDTQVKLAFASTSNEFASESYEVGAAYYITKPYEPEKLRAMLRRLLPAEQELVLPDGARFALRDICYADFSGHSVTLHGVRGALHTARMPFSELEALLRPYPCFCSPGRGLLVNFHAVTGTGSDVFLLRGGTQLPISRRRTREVKEAYSAFRFAELRKEGTL